VWFSNELIEVGIAPDGFAIRLRGERHVRQHEVSAAGDWHCALVKLEAELLSWRPVGVRSRLGRPALSVALSLNYVRFFRLPWSESLLNRGRAAVFAATQFASAGSPHGAVPDAFSYLVEDAPPGAPRLACAIEHALLVALDDMARRTNTRLVSATSWVVAAMNMHARHLPTEGWFVAIEDAHLALVTLSAGVACEIAVTAWSDEGSSFYPGTGSGWRIALARLERRVRLRSARAEGLPIFLLDASSRGVVASAADLVSLPLVTFIVPEHLALPERVDTLPTESGGAHSSLALPGAGA